MLIAMLGLMVSLAAPQPPAGASASAGDPPLVPLDQIRRALAMPPPSLVLVIPAAAVTFRTTAAKPIGPPFPVYLHELFALNTLQRQSADWASKGQGINLVELAHDIHNAFQARDERRIHDEVARELEALRKLKKDETLL